MVANVQDDGKIRRGGDKNCRETALISSVSVDQTSGN